MYFSKARKAVKGLPNRECSYTELTLIMKGSINPFPHKKGHNRSCSLFCVEMEGIEPF